MDENQTHMLFQAPDSLIYDRKFDTALRDSTYIELVKRHEGHRTQPDDDLFLRFLPDTHDLSKYHPRDQNPQAECVDRLFQKADKASVQTKLSRRTGILTSRLMKMQISYMASGTTGRFKESLKRLASFYGSFAPGVELSVFLEAALRMSNLVEKFTETKALHQKAKIEKWDTKRLHQACLDTNHWEDPFIDLRVSWSLRFCFIQIGPCAVILPRAGILQLANKISDISSVLMYMRTQDGHSLEKGAFSTTCRFTLHLCDLARQYGVHYYEIAKNLESFAAAEALVKHDDWDNNQFLKALNKELALNTGFKYIGSPLQRFFIRASTALSHELSCLGKILGHPVVNMERGTQKLYDATHGDLGITTPAVAAMIAEALRSFVTSYILKHSKWPPMMWSCDQSSVPSGIRVAQERNQDPNHPDITRIHGPTCPADYLYVKLEPIAEFDYVDNIIPLLKDRTVSLLRSQVFDTFLRDNTKKKRIPWAETRLLLAYLMCPEVMKNHQRYIRRFMNAKDLGQFADYLVIKIVPKEKELKVDFRGFGCKTADDRLRSVIQEQNTARFLKNYCPEQTMTLSELDILRKLSAYRNILEAYPGHKVIYIVIDASKWNNRQRHAVISPLADALLDPLYNTRIFAKTQEAFHKTFVYVPDESSVQYWEGQEGGIEGLHQYTWDVAYLAAIRSTLHDEDHAMFPLVKGDDLRLAVIISPGSPDFKQIDLLKDRLVAKISHRSRALGHKIKVEESYGSSKYFSFSKAASVGQICLPQGCRKIQKAYGASNAFLMFLDSFIGAAFSNAHSACHVGTDFNGPYMVALMWAFSHLCKDPRYSALTDAQLVALMLVPSLLGGFPIIYLHNMAVRAESDLLSPFLDIINFAETYEPAVAQEMEKFLKVKVQPVVVKGQPVAVKALCSDPYSLPIQKPVQPEALLRAEAAIVMEDITVRKEVRQMILAAKSPAQAQIMRCLASCNVYNAKIFAAIFKASPEGILKKFLAKFESSRSINELLTMKYRPQKVRQVLKRVISAEVRLQRWRVKMFNRRPHGLSDLRDYQINCPAQWASNIRRGLYGKPIEGITMPPMAHQVKIGLARDMSSDSHAVQNHFTYTLLPAVDRLDDSTFSYTVGDKQPFHGYKTKSGTTIPTESLPDKDELVNNVTDLLELIGWTARGGPDPDDPDNLLISNIPSLCSKMIRIYTDVDVELLMPYAGSVKSGTVQHHLRSPKFKESIVPNCLSNAYTRIKGESDTHLTFGFTPAHYRMNFLHVYCHTICLWSSMLQRDPQCPTTVVWAETQDCVYCLTPIAESCLVADELEIASIDLHPIRSTMIGQTAERILEASAQAIRDKDRKLYTDVALDELSVAAAATGLLQEVTDSSMLFRARLQVATTGHHLTDVGHTVMQDLVGKADGREVGTSEVKRIPGDVLTATVLTVIQDSARRTWPQLGAQRCLNESSMLPAEELPWHGLILFLSRSRRLDEVLAEACIRSDRPLPRAFGNPGAATRHLGFIAILSPVQTVGPTYTIALSKYGPSDIMRWVDLQWKGIQRRIVDNILQGPVITARPSWGTANQLVDSLRLALCVFLMPGPMQSTVIEELSLKTSGQEIDIMSLIDFEMDIGSLWDAIHDETEGVTSYTADNEQQIDLTRITYLMDQYVYEEWAVVLENTDDAMYLFEDAWEDARNRIRDQQAHLVLSDLNTCIHKIRSLPPAQGRPTKQRRGNTLEAPAILLAPHSSNFLLTTDISTRRLGAQLLGDDQNLDVIVIERALYAYTQHRYITIGNTSPSRLSEALQKGGLLHGPRSGKICLCLADGMGGMSCGLMVQFPGSLVFFSTLQRPEADRDTGHTAIGPTVADYTGSKLDMSLGTTGLGDLSAEEASVVIPAHCRNRLMAAGRDAVDIITCDMDPLLPADDDAGMSEYLPCLWSAISVAVDMGHGHSHFICKIVSHNVLVFAKAYVLASQVFKTVNLGKLDSSAASSPELYLYCYGALSIHHRLETREEFCNPRRGLDPAAANHFLTKWNAIRDLCRAKKHGYQIHRPRSNVMTRWPTASKIPYQTAVVRPLETWGVDVAYSIKRLSAVRDNDPVDAARHIVGIIRQYERAELASTTKARGMRVDVGYRHLVANLDTRRHMVELGHRAMFCKGIIYRLTEALERLRAHQEVYPIPRVITYRRFITAVREIEDLGRRLDWVVNAEQLWESWTVTGEEGDQPAMHYILGERSVLYILPLCPTL